jgi:dihydroorotase
MKYIVKNVLILDKRSPFYKRKLDIEIDRGRILRAERNLKTDKAYKLIEGKQVVLSTSFVDINASSGEPYRLEAETLDSFIEVASNGGFGYIAHMPGDGKFTQSKSDIAFLKSKNSESLSQVLPIGNLTKAENETIISSMMDMRQAGAVAFSDGNDSTPSLGVLKNAMLYSSAFGGKLMIHPEKKVLSKKGQVNQGLMSLMLGYKGIPKESEFMSVAEIIQLAQYTNTEVLFLNITTPESLKLISAANKEKKQFYTAISSLHLSECEAALKEYNTNFKLNPPLRSAKDQKAMIKAAIEGKVDMVYSQHMPCTPEEKVLEFDMASYGAINLQTSVLSCIAALGADNIERCIDLMSTQPANYLGIEFPTFEIGVAGSFVLLDLDSEFELSSKNSKSKSVNSPFFGRKFSSKILGLISNGQQQFFN